MLSSFSHFPISFSVKMYCLSMSDWCPYYVFWRKAFNRILYDVTLCFDNLTINNEGSKFYSLINCPFATCFNKKIIKKVTIFKTFFFWISDNIKYIHTSIAIYLCILGAFCSLSDQNFFLIGNMSTIIDEIIKKKHTMCSWGWTTTAKHKTENKKKNNQETKLREEKNCKREEQSVNSQNWDQSKRLCWHKPFNSTKDFSESSNEQPFHSVQIVHIKQPGIKFQMSELCFPSQWLQQNNTSAIEPGWTH